MDFKTFGNIESPALLLIPGLGVSYEIFLPLIGMLGYIPVIAKRIRNEEKVPAAGLEGYKEYQSRIRYR